MDPQVKAVLAACAFLAIAFVIKKLIRSKKKGPTGTGGSGSGRPVDYEK